MQLSAWPDVGQPAVRCNSHDHQLFNPVTMGMLVSPNSHCGEPLMRAGIGWRSANYDLRRSKLAGGLSIPNSATVSTSHLLPMYNGVR